MDSIFYFIDLVVSIIGPVSDFFWEFPTNFEWYSSIPVLGEFSFSTFILVGSGIYFTFRLRFIQVAWFKKGVKILAIKYEGNTGISPLTAFLLSSGIRIGPGNILGVTGAIAAGGPGALFWMWVSAFFGMATSYVESTLAQIFKERRGNEFIGGLPYYAKTLCNNKAWVGVIASSAYIMYSLCGIPVDSFNTVTGIASLTRIITGTDFSVQSDVYYYIAAVVIFLVALMAFGGIKRVTKACDIVVPIMTSIYILTVISLILYNYENVPYFFHVVFEGAFTPDAMFGGALGITLVQGVKRGLMSNEAGQGTITMAAGVAGAKHPCEQGLVGAVGVFLDTHIICTMTAFIIIMAHRYMIDPQGWEAAETYSRFLMSISSMTPGFLETVISFLLSLCFSMFAYTCVIGMVTFSEISARRISDNPIFVTAIRILCIFVSAFGILSSIAGYDLSRMWAFEDLGNIVIVYVNILMLHIGFKYVKLATKHFERYGNVNFISRDVIGIDTPYWRKGSDIE
ncbi:MAG: alanine/glycine:cation symporter family protein [Dialister pneumosintes]